MIFEEIDFENKEVKKSLSLKGIEHSNNWESYYENFSYCVNIIISKGLPKGYFFNPKCRPILFLIRHSWELYLKKLISSDNLKIPLTHDFNELFLTLNQNQINHEIEEELFAKLNFEGDGACFKYYSNKNGEPYFNHSSKIDLSEIIKDYNLNRNKQTQDFRLANLCDDIQYSNKIKWNFTLHLGEARQLMHIKTQYDQIIEFLMSGILKNEIDLARLYLPLLFLVRHSLEIGLKWNIYEIQRMSPLIKSIDYSNVHSLSRLYNCYSGFLNKIKKEQLDEKTFQEIKEFQRSYESLNDLIHKLDKNSNYFRFPISESEQTEWTLTNKTVYNIMKLYYFTDKFITFTNNVLEDEGIVTDENNWL